MPRMEIRRCPRCSYAYAAPAAKETEEEDSCLRAALDELKTRILLAREKAQEYERTKEFPTWEECIKMALREADLWNGDALADVIWEAVSADVPVTDPDGDPGI